MNIKQATPSKNEYDVIVVGGGPSGSTAATLSAKNGLDVLLLDREQFPRFRVGESLMPATYPTFERLGVLDRLRKSEFPVKASVQFFSPAGRSGAPFYFSEVNPGPDATTWQVDRVEFDKMLLDNAVENGVEVRQCVNVRDVRFEGSRAVGVLAELPDRSRHEIDAKVVVDASGQSGVISRKLGLKEIDPKLRHMSYYTRFRGAVVDEGINAGATLIYWTREGRSWFWFIPLPDGIVSVGVVGPVDYLQRNGAADPRTIFDDELDNCPALKERLEGAEHVAEVRVIRDFSYLSSRIAGDGWVLAGDAFGFLDPMYSTGVFLALKSGELAADAVADAFANNDFSASRLGRHGESFVAGMEALRKLVYAYYDEAFSFQEFLERFPGFRDDLVNLLVGNVFDRPVDNLFEAMGEMCDLPEARTLQVLEERK
jgi:flavin-dependent dehydrogenase